MKFGLHLDNAHTRSPGATISNWRESASIADATGFDYVSVVDHLVPFPRFRQRDVPLFDPWQILSALAVLTRNVTLLTLVSNGTISHPVRLAKQAATLDALSNGRMMLGLGAGGYDLDEAAIGIDARSQRERYTRLGECADLVMSLWSGQEVSYQGNCYTLDRYTSSPAPLHTPSLLIAGKSMEILRIAASKASACNFAFADLRELDALIKNLGTFLDDTGSSLAEFDVTLLDRVFIGASDGEARRAWQAAGAPTVNGNPGLIGGVAKLIQDITALEQAGANTLFCMFHDVRSLRHFAEGVLPQLRGARTPRN